MRTSEQSQTTEDERTGGRRTDQCFSERTVATQRDNGENDTRARRARAGNTYGLWSESWHDLWCMQCCSTSECCFHSLNTLLCATSLNVLRRARAVLVTDSEVHLFAVDQRAAATAKPMTIVFELRHSGSGEGCTQGVFLVESRIGSERVLGLQMYGLE